MHTFSSGRLSINWRFFLRLVRLLIVSRRHRKVRTTVVFLFSNVFALLSLAFAGTIALVFLGLIGLPLPIPRALSTIAVSLLF